MIIIAVVVGSLTISWIQLSAQVAQAVFVHNIVPTAFLEHIALALINIAAETTFLALADVLLVHSMQTLVHHRRLPVKPVRVEQTAVWVLRYAARLDVLFRSFP